MTRVQPMLVDDEWISTDHLTEVTDPEDGRVLALVPDAGPQQCRVAVDAAAVAAREAKHWPAHRRAAVLARAAETIAAERESFARTIAEEGVKTIREARAEADRCVTTLRLSAAQAERLGGEEIRFDGLARGEHRVGYWTRDPVGVVLAITPFNDPLNLVAHKVGPALAAGNSVILKPHERTPLSALRLAATLIDAGLPPRVLQVVTGRGDVVGGALVRDQRVDMVSFTGGRATGDRIARAAGARKLAMELGGNSATIVLDDADLDLAVPAISSGAFAAAGQNCLHVQQVLIHQRIYDDLAERLVQAALAVRLGPKLCEDTDMGPLICTAAAARVSTLVEQARINGARVLTGGVRKGTGVTPTLIDRVGLGQPLTTEEVFGPVTVLHPVAGMADALDIANACGSNLQTAVFTSSLDTAFTAIRGLETGGVMVNDSTDFRTDAMPFGGTKGSGVGREGVRYAVEMMSEPKVVCFSWQAAKSSPVRRLPGTRGSPPRR